MLLRSYSENRNKNSKFRGGANVPPPLPLYPPLKTEIDLFLFFKKDSFP